MYRYEIIFEELQDRVDSGLLTLEEAEMINEAAYEKYFMEATAKEANKYANYGVRDRNHDCWERKHVIGAKDPCAFMSGRKKESTRPKGDAATQKKKDIRYAFKRLNNESRGRHWYRWDTEDYIPDEKKRNAKIREERRVKMRKLLKDVPKEERNRSNPKYVKAYKQIRKEEKAKAAKGNRDTIEGKYGLIEYNPGNDFYNPKSKGFKKAVYDQKTRLKHAKNNKEQEMHLYKHPWDLTTDELTLYSNYR